MISDLRRQSSGRISQQDIDDLRKAIALGETGAKTVSQDEKRRLRFNILYYLIDLHEAVESLGDPAVDRPGIEQIKQALNGVVGHDENASPDPKTLSWRQLHTLLKAYVILHRTKDAIEAARDLLVQFSALENARLPLEELELKGRAQNFATEVLFRAAKES